MLKRALKKIRLEQQFNGVIQKRILTSVQKYQRNKNTTSCRYQKYSRTTTDRNGCFHVRRQSYVRIITNIRMQIISGLKIQ